MTTNIWLTVAIAYLLGSIPTGYIIARYARGVDIREVGDRYSGAKNVFREIGPAAGVATAIGDVAKGALAVLQTAVAPVPDYALIPIGLAVVAGHIWPVFLQFRGGAGLAPAIGVVFAALPRESLFLLGPFILLLATVGRKVGIGAVSASLLLPLVVLSWWLGEPPSLFVLPLIVGTLVSIRVYHRQIGEALRVILGARPRE